MAENRAQNRSRGRTSTQRDEAGTVHPPTLSGW